MAQPLLPIVPLLLSTAAASPPVAPQRVTGNVSTEHHRRHVRPVTDACRVTGNIVPTKSASGRSCRLTLAEGTRNATLWLGDDCRAEGRWQAVDATRVCVLPSPDPAMPPLHVPEDHAEDVVATLLEPRS